MLVLPMVGWAVTGFVFFVKPGYGGAYEMLNVKTYALDSGPSITPRPGWREFRVFRTILGEHLLILTFEGWRHLNPQTLQSMPAPSEDDVKRLVNDAFTANPARYGRITGVAGNLVTTDTGVEVTLDWNRVSLQQKGRDTDRIDRLYKVHYLQWTGVKGIDRVLGFVGLSLVLVLTGFGVRLALGRK
ncbi:MAG TPA: hypothetical protein VMZ90_11660 [Vicinamibacterales bacterium]|nr:hypothetical protein [Vicinamibacterales bacterium]